MDARDGDGLAADERGPINRRLRVADERETTTMMNGRHSLTGEWLVL